MNIPACVVVFLYGGNQKIHSEENSLQLSALM